jgi:catechol 2,3-dioxygenase-like lactoylglutathione lyase family enzyme
MIRPSALIHVVASLERSVAFYRDAVGLELSSPPAPLIASTLAHQVKTAAPTAQVRAASFAVPGSEMELMLVEFSGTRGKPFTQRLYDPGVTRFSIQVRDIDKAFARVKDAGIVVDTTGGRPVFTQRPRNNTRAVMMRDPDGFVFEFVQPDPLPPTTVAVSSNIFNARASLAIEEITRSLAFYRDLLGFTARPTNKVTEDVLRLEGTPGAVVTTTSTTPPGSTNVWFLWEFYQVPRLRRAPNVQDPGASALSLLVEDLQPLLERMKAAKVEVETPSGAPVGLGQGLRGVLVRSPDGLLIELIERTQ